MDRRLAVRAIIMDDSGKLFCMKLKDRKTKQPLKHWCLPGGGLDIGESLLAGLHRELVEETGVIPKIGELLYIQQYMDTKEQLEFFFHVTNSADYKDFDITKATHAADEIADYGFVNPADVYLLPTFLATEDLAAQIDSGSPTKLFSYL